MSNFFHTVYRFVHYIVLAALSKGCPRWSRNYGPTWTKRCPGWPRAFRRTWSTRCKGNTEGAFHDFFSIFGMITIIFLFVCFFFFVYIFMDCIFGIPLQGSYWYTWSSRSRGKARATGKPCLTPYFTIKIMLQASNYFFREVFLTQLNYLFY